MILFLKPLVSCTLFSWQKKIPNSELVVFEESYHYLFIDEPQKFIAEISAFVQRTFGA
ncbi:hypothetical protein BRE01_66040 [Brevibacillus reuszeri]|uniref:Alpha/beta hydrolase n=1 Tax=Brevibacillus reuszeri TaxID=54915 RepID=A0ABQ0TYI8_9BACL|nr:hypothetical protein BRE01_66040 [Brevibacillus reuszeri]